MQGKATQATCVLATLAFAAMSFFLMVKEYRSFYDGAGIDPMFYITAPDAFASEPLGLRSISFEIERCFRGIDALWGSILNSETRKSGLQKCLFLAERTLSRIPTHASALQLKSETQLHLGSRQAAERTLISATKAAPNTAWLAQRRLMIMLQLSPTADETINAIIDADVKNLIKFNETSKWMAQVYAQNETLHGMVERNEKLISKQDAEFFVTQVRQTLRDIKKSQQVVE